MESDIDCAVEEDDYARWEELVLLRLESGDVHLPLMPPTAASALERVNDPNLNTHDLADLLEHDAAIAASIVRVASSAAYSGGGEIESVNEAVARIGTRTFCQLVSALAIQGEIYRGTSHSAAMNILRRHSLVNASIAAQIAVRVGADSGIAFLSGLLFTIGKPIVWHLVHEIERDLGITIETADFAELMENFQAEMCGLICKEWDMPPVVQAVCGRSVRLESEKAKYRTEYAIVFLAHHLAGHTCGTATRQLIDFASLPEARFLDMELEDIREILEEVRSTRG